MNQRIKILVLAIAFQLLAILTVIGQGGQHYLGQYQLGPYSGVADLQFVITKRDTFLEGPFNLNSVDANAFFTDTDNYFSFEGQYLQNVPDGQWELEFGQFSSSGSATLEDLYYRVGIDGTQHNVSGTIRDGAFVGTWQHIIQKIEKSVPKAIAFKSEIEFEDGVPQQAFRINNDSFTLLGRFLRDGLAHDTWTLYSDVDHIEDWTFVEGRLTNVKRTLNDRMTTIYKSEGRPENTRVINLDARYFKLLAVNQRILGIQDELFEGHAARLLTTNAANYNKVNSVLSAKNGLNFMPNFRVSASYHPLTSDEVQKLDSTAFYLSRATQQFDLLLNNSSLNIIQLSDAQVADLFADLKDVRINSVSPIQEIISYREDSLLEFVNRDQLLNYLQLEDEDPLEIIKKANKRIDSIRLVLYNKLSPQDLIQANTAVEMELVATKNYLDSLASMHEDESIKDANSEIRHLSDLILKEYSAARTMSEGKRAKETQDCLDRLIGLIQVLNDLPQRWDQIKEEYTDQVWNNNTSTVMTEEVKKRLTLGYKEVLIPYYLNQVREHISCENVDELQKMFNATYQRMLILRTEETRKLERKLKREDNPTTIMQLFSIASTL